MQLPRGAEPGRRHLERPSRLAAALRSRFGHPRSNEALGLEPRERRIHRADRYRPPGRLFDELLHRHRVGAITERAHREQRELFELANPFTFHETDRYHY